MSHANMPPDAELLIRQWKLEPHPEGGWYRETWRGPPGDGGRATATSILFLLQRGERSHWHRIDASEIWLHHAGAPMRLTTASGATVLRQSIGTDPSGGGVLQAVVDPGVWQSAEPEGEWSLVACVVAPGFDFAGFELAPPGWEPADAAQARAAR